MVFGNVLLYITIKIQLATRNYSREKLLKDLQGNIPSMLSQSCAAFSRYPWAN